MSVTKGELLAWLTETFWLVFSEGPRLDHKPGCSVLAMSPLGTIKEFRFTPDGAEPGILSEIEEMH